MVNSSTQTRSAADISPELQQWLERRDSLIALKTRFQKDVGHISLLPEAVDPKALSAPLRKEAITYLHPPKANHITPREEFLKAFQLKVRYI